MSQLGSLFDAYFEEVLEDLSAILGVNHFWMELYSVNGLSVMFHCFDLAEFRVSYASKVWR